MSYARKSDAQAWWHFPHCGLLEAAERFAEDLFENTGEREVELEVTSSVDSKVFRVRATRAMQVKATVILSESDKLAIQQTKDTEPADKARGGAACER